MKRFILLAVTLVCFMFSAFAEDEYAEITFREKEYDFGYIKEEKGKVSCDFEFENTGTKPLIIIGAMASCGCTKPDYPKRPIAPGKKGVLKVTYDPAHRPGPFKKDIRVKTNSQKRNMTLSVIGCVIPEGKDY